MMLAKSAMGEQSTSFGSRFYTRCAVLLIGDFRQTDLMNGLYAANAAYASSGSNMPVSTFEVSYGDNLVNLE